MYCFLPQAHMDSHSALMQMMTLRNTPLVYATNNRFAYYTDLYKETNDIKHKRLADAEMKTTNFVPTYDKWCLYCDNKSKVEQRCSICKTVYFCNAECQRKAWQLHKNHCRRDLFTLCAACGVPTPGGGPYNCRSCPVRFCSEKCEKQIGSPHREIDCPTFMRLFKQQ